MIGVGCSCLSRVERGQFVKDACGCKTRGRWTDGKGCEDGYFSVACGTCLLSRKNVEMGFKLMAQVSAKFGSFF